MKCFFLLCMILWISNVLFAAELTVGKNSRFQTIQEAVDQSKNGDVITILEGKYTFDSSISISEKSNLTIQGKGKVDLICSDYIPVISLYQCKNIIISNIHGVHSVDTKKAEESCGPGATIISAYSCDGITVSSSELNGCGVTGFYSMDSKNIILTGNYIHSNVGPAIFIGWEGQDYGKNRIENNRIENNYDPVVIQNDYYFAESTSVPSFTFRGNTFKNNDLEKKIEKVIKGQKYIFRKWVSYAEWDNPSSPVVSGPLNQDTSVTLGGSKFAFKAYTMISFHPDGSVLSGYLASEKSINADGETFTAAKGGYVEFYQNGKVLSIQTVDGKSVSFGEDGSVQNVYDPNAGVEY